MNPKARRMMQTTTSKDGTTIAYEKSGTGPAIILVDGALSYHDLMSMKPLAQLLASDFTVYTYDRRGRGESDDTLPYAVEREIEDLEAIISIAGNSAYVFGHSGGAVLSVKAAAQLGSKITKLAVYEAPLATTEQSRQARQEYNAQLVATLAKGDRDGAVALFMKVIGVPEEYINAMREDPKWHWNTMETLAHTLAYDAAVTEDGSVPAAASQVSIPALVMSGGASPAMMREGAQLLAKAIANAQLQTLEGQEHDPAPEVIAPILKDFFKHHK